MFMSNHLIGFGGTTETASSIALAGTIATTNFSATGSSHPLNMPSGITAGELLCLVMMLDRNRAAPSGLSGWTQLFYDAGDPGLGFYYKTAAGGETLTLGYGAGINASYAVFRLTGFATGVAPEAATATTGSSTAPNSGSITPSWGSNNSFVISMCSGAVATSLSVTGIPTNYTGPTPASGTGSGAMAYRILTMTSEDPGAFTTSSISWRARTVAIKGN